MKIYIIAIAIIAALAGTAWADGFGCTECHSKNPKLKAMHEALEFKDCFTCHNSVTNVRFSDEAKRNRDKDPRCVRCHQNDKGK